MKSKAENFGRGLTLVEVMVTLVIALIIVIGVIMYMYSSALNARTADVRITATRIGQLLLDGWKITGTVNTETGVWDVEAFNPTDYDFDFSLPVEFVGDLAFDLGGVGNELGDYSIKIDGAYYFITLSYENDNTDASYPIPLYRLNACVAWNRDLISSNLNTDAYNYINITSYANF